jgi:PAS domain S-box-containing protein
MDVALEVRALKAAGYEVTYAVAETAVEMKAALAEQAFDIVISDHGLPQFDAPGALAVLKESGLDIPFIVVSGSIGEETAVALMKAGAHDYVMKDRLSRLVPAVQKELREAESRRERKRAEETLKFQYTLLTALINSSKTTIIFSLDNTYCYTAFNEKHREEMKKIWNADITIGMNLLECMQIPEIRALAKQSIDRALSGETFSEIQHQPDPATYYEFSWNPIYQNEEIVGVTVFVRDITERARAEEALRESFERFQLANRATFDTIWDWNLQTDALWWNENLQLTFGHQPEEIEPGIESWTNRIHPEDLELVKTGIHAAIDSGKQSWSDEYRFRRKDGSYAIVADRGFINRDTSGKPMRMIGAMEDITERKQAEEALEKSEEQYRQFFEDDLSGDYISMPDGKIISCNPAFARIFGFASVEDVLNSDASSLYAEPESRETFLRLLREKKKLEYYESEYLRHDGAQVCFVQNAIGTFDPQGDLVQIRGYIFDESKRKLLERQLIQAQKLESLGTLASGIAHDFNNILGIILGYASLLTRQISDPDNIKNSAEAVVKASMRGAALVKQLLTFARKGDTQLTLVKLNDVVNEISKLLGETIAKTIEITLDLDKGLPVISADATQIHQVMLNLCVNARDAMPNGGTLTIVTQLQQSDAIRNKFPKAAAPQYIVLSVTDTGVGMDEKTRSRIFEPFFTTKEIGKGTGLGLSVVFGILESHKGFVNVESEPGKGTTFYLYFPVPESMENEQAKAEIQKEIPRGTETILVVEDEEMLRELLKNILQSAGYRVFTAIDGKEAIDLFRQHRDDIQLVLSDLGLPKLSGYDVFRKMKLMKSDVRFILVSGFMESQTKTEMSKEGIKDFIQKPFSFYTVMLSIRTVLD